MGKLDLGEFGIVEYNDSDNYYIFIDGDDKKTVIIKKDEACNAKGGKNGQSSTSK